MPRDPLPLQGCHVLSLRPAGCHGAMRGAAARAGAGTIALSPWRLRPCTGAQTRRSLRAALAADIVVFTSPAAVRAAAALAPLRARRGQAWLAVGEGSARALAAAGVRGAAIPARADSEGLLALPVLQAVRGTAVGLVTAPEGRAMLAGTLARRGARIRRADVYVREPVAPAASAVARLAGCTGPLWLALSSGQALDRLLATLPAPARARVLDARVSAASERLAAQARALGFGHVVRAAGPRPAQLVRAMTEAAGAG